jgi:hypothetical protein
LVLVTDHKYRFSNELAVITGFSKGIPGIWDIYKVYYIKKNEFEKCYKNEMKLLSKG